MKASLTPRTNQRLRQARVARNWRQCDLAEQLGTTVVSVKRWELGSHQPGAYYRIKLCALFGLSAEELGLVDGSTTTQQSSQVAAPTTSSPPEVPVLWTIPYQRNPYFTGRDDLLEQLVLRLLPGTTTSGRTMPTRPQAIRGLGGIGKTQLAIEYAYRAQEQVLYTHTFWINAASEEAILASFVGLAELLPAFPAREETNQRKLVAAVKRWLEQCQQRWLLIFDNADDLSMVQEYFPRQNNGSILLTTRAHAVAAIASAIEVEPLGLREGTHFLLHRVQRLDTTDEENNEAANVVTMLGGFPLALDQAGAYIEETGCSFEEYFQRYQDYRKVLLTRRGTQATNYPDSVATTWSLSFQRVEWANPAAAELLRLCAFLASDHIPEELLQEGAAYWPPVLQAAATNLFAFDQMLEELLKFSLVKRFAQEHLLSIHRLVQAVLRDTMEPEQQRQWAMRVVRAVHALFPGDPKEEVVSWPRCLRYLEQVQACATLIQQHALVLPEAADLLSRAGVYLNERASYTLAELLFQRALHIWEQLEEPEHFLAIEPLSGLAHLRRQQGKFEEAESLFQHVLSICERQFGPEHARVASTLNNLALLSSDQGRFGEAEPLFQRALRIWEQLEHPKVAYALNGLANLYYHQEKFGEAKPLYQRALHIWEQQLGVEHPLVAAPLNNLAIIAKKQGKLEEAEALYQKARRIWEQQLGLEHVQVAYALVNLALLFFAQGRFGEAKHLFQRALRILEQQLGPEHPLVAHPLNGLADLYRAQSRYIEAEPLYERALRIREHSEPDHPDTAETLSGLAALREAQGRDQEAALLYQRALSIRERVFGK